MTLDPLISPALSEYEQLPFVGQPLRRSLHMIHLSRPSALLSTDFPAWDASSRMNEDVDIIVERLAAKRWRE